MIYLFISLYTALIFVSPTINVGVPLRLEDILLLLFFITNSKSSIKIDKKVYTILLILLIFSIICFISLFISVLRGYSSSLQDFNTIIMYFKVIFIFLLGYSVAGRIKNYNKGFIYMGFGLLISSISSLIQYYNILGLGEKLYLIYGKEDKIFYGINRAIGTVGNPNYAAYFSIILVSLILCFNLKKMHKLIIIIPIAACIVTYSRTGLLTLILVITLYLLLKRKIKLLIFLGFILSSTIILYSQSLFEDTRLAILTQNDDGFDSNFGGRADLIWQQKIDLFINNPIVGIGTLKNSLSNTIFDITVFDNSYLYLAVTSGILGLFFYFLFYYKIFKNIKFKKNITLSNIDLFAILFLFATLLFFITTDLIKNIYYISYNMFLLGFLYQKLTLKNNDPTINKRSNIELEQRM